MKIRDASAPSKKPEVQEIPQHLYDKNLMDGIVIDPADQQKERKNRFLDSAATVSSQSSLSKKAPDTKITGTTKEGEWTRQDTPSLGVPYGTGNLWVRPLTVAILSKVHAAQVIGEKDTPSAKQAGYTMLVDALAPTIRDFDIRNLTVPDFNSHIYWLRINSYPKSPFTIPWTSRYGNENKSRVTASHFEFEELAMTREEVLEWQEKGITFPTVRDFELLLDPSLDAETEWTMTYAQYIYLDEEPSPEYMRRKIDILQNAGPDIIADIKEFALRASHGVVEQVKLRDEAFDLDSAIAFLHNQMTGLMQVLEENTADRAESGTDDISSMIALGNYVQGLAAEIGVLTKVKENNGLDERGLPFKPEMEVVALASANATFLFP